MKTIETLWTILIVLWVVGSAVLKIWKKGKQRIAREHAVQPRAPQRATPTRVPTPARARVALPVQRAAARPAAASPQAPDLSFLKDALADLGIEVPPELQQTPERAEDRWSPEAEAREEVSENGSWDEAAGEEAVGEDVPQERWKETFSAASRVREDASSEAVEEAVVGEGAGEEFQAVGERLDEFWEKEQHRDSWHRQGDAGSGDMERTLSEAIVMGSLLTPRGQIWRRRMR